MMRMRQAAARRAAREKGPIIDHLPNYLKANEGWLTTGIQIACQGITTLKKLMVEVLLLMDRLMKTAMVDL